MAEVLPTLNQYEGLIRFAASHATKDTYEQEDICQNLRLKFEECLKRVQSVKDFAKYYKTAIWNYVRSYVVKKKPVKPIDTDKLENRQCIKKSNNQEFEFEGELALTVEYPKKNTLWSMYENGILLELLREKKQDGKKMSKWTLFAILRDELQIDTERIKGLLNEHGEKAMAKEVPKLDRKTYRQLRAAHYREYRKKYRKNHPDRIKQQRLDYRTRNQARLLEYGRGYREKHGGDARQYQQEYCQVCAEKRRATQKKYVENHVKELQQYQKQYYADRAAILRVKRAKRYQNAQEAKLQAAVPLPLSNL